jgi:molecular chaperone GrpE
VNQALQAEVASLRQQLQDAQAEAAAAGRRHQRQLDDAKTFAVSKLATGVCDVADALYWAQDSLPAGVATGARRIPVSARRVAAIADGIASTSRQLSAVLSRSGVEPVMSLGKTFDPACMEALAQDSNPEFPPGAVTSVFREGYTIGGAANRRVLRPAQVTVNRK